MGEQEKSGSGDTDGNSTRALLPGGGCDRLEDEVLIESKWKWYFSTSVDPKDHEESEKKKKSGKHVTMEDRNRTREHAWVVCLLNKSV